MPFKIQQSTIDKIFNIIKSHNIINKSDLVEESKIHSYSVDKVLDILEKDGKIIIAKYQSFVGNKVVTQSYDIKYIGDKKEDDNKK